MNAKQLEKRISDLEAEVSALRHAVRGAKTSPWWERITGTFENDPAYKKAMQLGKQYRKSQKPSKRSGGK